MYDSRASAAWQPLATGCWLPGY